MASKKNRRRRDSQSLNRSCLSPQCVGAITCLNWLGAFVPLQAEETKSPGRKLKVIGLHSTGTTGPLWWTVCSWINEAAIALKRVCLPKTDVVKANWFSKETVRVISEFGAWRKTNHHTDWYNTQPLENVIKSGLIQTTNINMSSFGRGGGPQAPTSDYISAAVMRHGPQWPLESGASGNLFFCLSLSPSAARCL